MVLTELLNESQHHTPHMDVALDPEDAGDLEVRHGHPQLPSAVPQPEAVGRGGLGAERLLVSSVRCAVAVEHLTGLLCEFYCTVL